MQLSRVLNLPYINSMVLFHRIRNVMAERDSRYILKGIIELDDTYLGRAKTWHHEKLGCGKTKTENLNM